MRADEVAKDQTIDTPVGIATVIDATTSPDGKTVVLRVRPEGGGAPWTLHLDAHEQVLGADDDDY